MNNDEIINNIGNRREIIGKVIPFPRGEWSVLNTYNVMDFVIYKGSGYVCVKKNENQVPRMNETYWTLVCEKGDKGDKGDTGKTGPCTPVFVGTWKPDVTYEKMDVVYYDGSSWVCIHKNLTGIKPGTKIDPYMSEKDIIEIGIILDPENKNDRRTWQMICKGVDYNIDKETGELSFYSENKDIQGVKTYTDNVYVRGTLENPEEISLKQKLNDMQQKLDKALSLLKKYNLWD